MLLKSEGMTFLKVNGKSETALSSLMVLG